MSINPYDEKVFSKNDIARVLEGLATDCFYAWQRTKDDRLVDEYMCYTNARDIFLNM